MNLQLFMITINLISQEQKNNLKNIRFYIAIKEAMTLLFLFVSIITIMLWVSRYYLEQQLSDLEIANNIHIKSTEDINNKIARFNTKINDINNIQKNFTYNHKIIKLISEIVPENVTLQQVKIFNQQKTVELGGLALTREDLIKFREILEKNEKINKVELPMSSLIEKENNSFIIKLEIDFFRL